MPAYLRNSLTSPRSPAVRNSNVDLEHAADWGQMTGHSEVAGTSSDQYRQTRQGLGMSLRAFRGGNPHERLVAIPDPNLLRAFRPTLCMIKDVHINNPKPLLRGIEFGAGTAHSRKVSRLQIFWRRMWLLKLGRLRSRAMLAIASFIMRYPDDKQLPEKMGMQSYSTISAMVFLQSFRSS
jgi:hypothetical protein